jgi:hypothetical protein
MLEEPHNTVCRLPDTWAGAEGVSKNGQTAGRQSCTHVLHAFAGHLRAELL